MKTPSCTKEQLPKLLSEYRRRRECLYLALGGALCVGSSVRVIFQDWKSCRDDILSLGGELPS